ncbi:MAG: hypothetical protein JWM98_1793 [Thermoleophilia bacterium]|nr:hypothetical protein [Thermoleophilia bacterium]
MPPALPPVLLRALGVLAACAAIGAASPASGATSSTVVTATVPSATSLDSATGCPEGIAGQTALGVVLPGSQVISSIPCTVTWGSSNDSSMIRAFQGDGRGAGMYRMTDGTRDTTFDSDGSLVSSLIAGNEIQRMHHTVAVQTDGKVVVAVSDAANTGFRIARFNENGTIDSAYGGGGTGRRTTTVPGSAAAQAYAVALQPDGKLVVAGWATGKDFVVVRYDVNGIEDASFGTGGIASVNPGTGSGGAYDVAIQPDGKIVLVGRADLSGTMEVAAARLAADGTLDTTFNGGLGHIRLSVSAFSDAGLAVELAPDGKIVIAGETDFVGTPANRFFLLIRLRADGTLDSPGFNGSGYRTLDFPAQNNERAYDVVVNPDLSIVVAGTSGLNNFAVAKVNAAGAVDTTFGTSGYVGFQFAASSQGIATGILRQPDGRYLVGGDAQRGAADYDAAFARLMPDGSFDTTLNGTGKLMVDIPVTSDETAGGLGFAPDGSVVQVGEKVVGANADTYVMRLVGTTMPDYGGANTWLSTNGFFAVCVGSVGGGSTADVATGTCSAADGAHWRAAPTAALKLAHTLAPGSSSVSLQFGLRVPAAQPPGSYVAPITFEVIAPAS